MNIALLGNPNTGKTSLFNNLTGSYEYVGNWSGVTVEKKVGLLKDKKNKLIDLPGIYTLNPLSKDEGIVTNFLLTGSFDKILNILDASQLERNMHLTIQLLEYGKPLIVGLNMIDVAANRGIQIDRNQLSAALGVPVVPVVARSGKGCEELAEITVSNSISTVNNELVYYDKEIEDAVLKLDAKLKGKTNHSSRWLTLQLLEGNPYVKDYLMGFIDIQQIEQFVSEVEKSVKEKYQVNSLEQFIYKKRKNAIEKIIKESAFIKTVHNPPLSERIDRIVTNKFLGIPIFLFFMYFVFMLTFDWLGFRLSDLLDGFISGPLTNAISYLLSIIGGSEFIRALVLEGIVAGVGGVLVFVPQIFILFFFISFLEDSGYMARVALVMDRFMEAAGLNGKAFIPMIIGFGCNVPGIMAARTIETPKERLLTVLLTPLMSCSARLPVYALFIGAFFVHHKAIIVLSLYVMGIVIALLLAKIFSSTILKGETSFFVIELPPYRLPQMKALWRSTWDKGKGFVKKAGTFIFAGSVLIWLLSYIGPAGVNVDMDKSFLAAIGGIFAPLLKPIGFGSWQAGASLLTGFLAKESIISTMNIIFFVPDEASLQGILSKHFSPLSAYSFMVFILLYIPCLATTATIYKETGSKKWTVFSMGYALTIAYVLAFIIYQGGRLFGLS
ncbi:ferrous iron transport protein B [Bacillus methanolicus]|uniref:Ferrous iron transport protein B n=1 Tax=Bacillus methanolicus (strain MGA3 / ATCC 53907) TaxID=796606 RepID=I3E7C2_BACMM|nr:ferrous iron transport protein B [Bacillus methanolicus]AIE59223.1 Ferrous iron transport protein B [Bacillus methanolicus MGA3]EIJ82393.1 Fe2+ transport system protein B [Bacillus methanolicus MGA3]